MTLAASALLAQFELAARAAQDAEADLRKTLAAQIAKAEHERIYAFRRARLVGLLAASLPAQGGSDNDAWTAQKSAVCDELGWSVLSDSYLEILTRMQPLAAAVRDGLQTPGEEKTTAVISELEHFEMWFLEAKGKPFYVLFDQYVPEVPVVDF